MLLTKGGNAISKLSQYPSPVSTLSSWKIFWRPRSTASTFRLRISYTSSSNYSCISVSTFNTLCVRISTYLSHSWSTADCSITITDRSIIKLQAKCVFLRDRQVFCFPGDWILTFFVLFLLERSLDFQVYASCEYSYKILFYYISSYTFNSFYFFPNGLESIRNCECVFQRRLYLTEVVSPSFSEKFDIFSVI